MAKAAADTVKRVVQELGGDWSAYANLARSNRVPTVIELGCADPDEPCRLPAGLQSDPYLKQVRARSLEAGLRFYVGAGNSADAYHITAPEPQGLGAISCMRFALEDACMQPSDIKHINAHEQENKSSCCRRSVLHNRHRNLTRRINMRPI